MWLKVKDSIMNMDQCTCMHYESDNPETGQHILGRLCFVDRTQIEVNDEQLNWIINGLAHGRAFLVLHYLPEVNKWMRSCPLPVEVETAQVYDGDAMIPPDMTPVIPKGH